MSSSIIWPWAKFITLPVSRRIFTHRMAFMWLVKPPQQLSLGHLFSLSQEKKLRENFEEDFGALF